MPTLILIKIAAITTVFLLTTTAAKIKVNSKYISIQLHKILITEVNNK
jgi:hypothetical protein